ncbi:efflux RND transporter periplasmic adaptor subunit [Photobacterium damselae]|uniref:efflux RND transporter periplasmic adaptor subunit n=1 Tax=Photobacterium damselae TaxID=38293 RepID=UPI0023402E58|nr:efflux RND transporter periplasmic adaptor subunit [Photobacterium damselae]MDC4168702.1 efflux RND transporter periplasmic adaptor subunit [Photobacterium damselae]
MKNVFSISLLALAIGAGGGYFAATQFSDSSSTESSAKNKEPLYWVAPMDPNYKRDKPGKSPMGMDLIPVYEEDNGGKELAGTVKISPVVENNLGVKTANVISAPLTPQIDTVGYVAFDESQLWQINSRVSGWIKKLNVNAIGERVKQGQVLFTLYSPELVRAQEELLNARRLGKTVLINGAKERLKSLGVDNSQINQLLKRGTASQTIAIKAPANGVIATLNVRQGAYLSPAQTVISAGSLQDVWVDVEVFERQAHWITLGTTADMKIDSLPGTQWQGKVDYIYPILDPKTRTLRIRVVFPNKDGALKPNMFANVELIPQSKNKVLQIPNQAVIRSGNMDRVVLALGDGKYRSTRIETGREAGDMIEVISGLTANDKIVTSAQFMIDSESSQTADLSRISQADQQADTKADTAWVDGTITKVMANHRMLTVHHQPVKAWNWPTMTMNFMVKDGIDISTLKADDAIRFEIKKNAQGQYDILDLEVKQSKPVINTAWGEGKITQIEPNKQQITLAHQPISALGWPAMTMNFTVAKSVNLSDLSAKQSIRFELKKTPQGQFEIIAIQVANPATKVGH